MHKKTREGAGTVPRQAGDGAGRSASILGVYADPPLHLRLMKRLVLDTDDRRLLRRAAHFSQFANRSTVRASDHDFDRLVFALRGLALEGRMSVRDRHIVNDPYRQRYPALLA